MVLRFRRQSSRRKNLLLQRPFLRFALRFEWTKVKNDDGSHFFRRILRCSPQERASETSAIVELWFVKDFTICRYQSQFRFRWALETVKPHTTYGHAVDSFNLQRELYLVVLTIPSQGDFQRLKVQDRA